MHKNNIYVGYFPVIIIQFIIHGFTYVIKHIDETLFDRTLRNRRSINSNTIRNQNGWCLSYLNKIRYLVIFL